MGLHKALLAILLFVFCSNIKGYSQYNNGENPWILGVGINLINDSLEDIQNLYDIQGTYHYHVPVSISIEKRFKYDFGIEGRINFNTQLTGKIVNAQVLEEDINLIAIDTHLKYYITNRWLNPRRAIYEGYITAGPGVTLYNSSESISLNVGAGINWFMSEQVRINTQAIAKKGVTGSKNGYLQLNIGLIFRLENSGSCSCF